MEQEEELSSQQSLELIAKMIKKAKRDYLDTGVSVLMWGGVVTLCSLVTFCNYYLHWPVLDYIWFLTVLAVIPQVLISIREGKNRKHKTYEDDVMGGIWISFGMSMFLLSWFTGTFSVPHPASIYLIIYGIPTFATGYARRYRPMILGGIACWIFAIASVYCDPPYTMIYVAAGAQLAWFIPGLLLRKCYLKAQRENV